MNNTTDFNYYNTLLVQSVGSKVGPIAPTITPSAAYGYENAEEAEGTTTTAGFALHEARYKPNHTRTR